MNITFPQELAIKMITGGTGNQTKRNGNVKATATNLNATIEDDQTGAG